MSGLLKLPLFGPIHVLVWAEIVKQKMLNTENNNNRFIIFGFELMKIYFEAQSVIAVAGFYSFNVGMGKGHQKKT